MPRRSKVDWDGVYEAAEPHDVLKHSELIRLGVSPAMISRRCKPQGPWQRLLPGVILLRNGPPTWEQRLHAAVRYAGPPQLITGFAGLHLHGLTRGPHPTQVHVLVHDSHQPASHEFVLVERTFRLPEPQLLRGFPTAPVLRCSLDGVRRLRDLNQIRATLAEVVQRRCATPQELLAELNAGSRRGTALPRRALMELVYGVRSPAESWAKQLAERCRFDSMWWNPELFLPNGSRLAIPDGWLDDVGLAWEIDSYEHHLSPEDYAKTLKRHNRMTAAGIIVVHTVPSRLRTEPAQVVAELRGAYELARQRPRPPVIARPSGWTQKHVGSP